MYSIHVHRNMYVTYNACRRESMVHIGSLFMPDLSMTQHGVAEVYSRSHKAGLRGAACRESCCGSSTCMSLYNPARQWKPKALQSGNYGSAPLSPLPASAPLCSTFTSGWLLHTKPTQQRPVNTSSKTPPESQNCNPAKLRKN